MGEAGELPGEGSGAYFGTRCPVREPNSGVTVFICNLPVQGPQLGAEQALKASTVFLYPSGKTTMYDEGVITKLHGPGQEYCAQAAEQREQTWADSTVGGTNPKETVLH